MSDIDLINDAVLAFYERLGVVDSATQRAGQDMLLSDKKAEKHLAALVMSHRRGTAPLGPEDENFEDLAIRWINWVTEKMTGYAIAELIARGEIEVMVYPEDGEFIFIHRREVERVLAEDD